MHQLDVSQPKTSVERRRRQRQTQRWLICARARILYVTAVLLVHQLLIISVKLSSVMTILKLWRLMSQMQSWPSNLQRITRSQHQSNSNPKKEKDKFRNLIITLMKYHLRPQYQMNGSPLTLPSPPTVRHTFYDWATLTGHSTSMQCTSCTVSARFKKDFFTPKKKAK